MDYSFLAARLSFTFMYTCIFFSWQINSAAAAAVVAFLSRVSTLTRHIDIAILSVCLLVCLSVRDVPKSDENGLTYRHSFFTIR